ncbi:unnamed protein product [Protopolystoma xenopodis]|uniref:Uncharacterized protein n=1 Tax=Protopolystoma xenopodis TaxID=117903 RepID=A0A3S5FC03_9PLAT|nr:unnamed protein product [Protopolystoma xenopodis]
MLMVLEGEWKVLPEAWGAEIVDMSEYVIGIPPCEPDESFPSFRPSTEGRRQSRTPGLTIFHQKHEGKKGGGLFDELSLSMVSCSDDVHHITDESSERIHRGRGSVRRKHIRTYQ